MESNAIFSDSRLFESLRGFTYTYIPYIPVASANMKAQI
jgi:hypothetical protein